MSNSTELKQLAATAALEYIKEGMNLGIGTGSTVDCLIEQLKDAPKPKAIVTSSKRSEENLAKIGYSCTDLNQVPNIDLYIDGADEVTSRRTMIKGGGGALTREKIVATAASKFIVMVDDSKLVDVLGKFPVAVEVLPMAQALVARKLVVLGGNPNLREGFITDENNIILDCRSLDLTDSEKMESTICSIPGVVDCGIFAKRTADLVLVANADKTISKHST